MSECLQVEFSRSNREEIIEYVKGLDTIYSDEHYMYKLNHTYDAEPSDRYIEVAIEPDVMDILLAYFQFKASDINMHYSFGQEESVQVLGELYGAIDLGGKVDVIDHHFDLYLNWEKWCGVAAKVEQLDILGHEGLNTEIKQLVPLEEDM